MFRVPNDRTLHRKLQKKKISQNYLVLRIMGNYSIARKNI